MRSPFLYGRVHASPQFVFQCPQLRFVGMQRRPEPCESLAQLGQESLRLMTMLESGNSFKRSPCAVVAGTMQPSRICGNLPVCGLDLHAISIRLLASNPHLRLSKTSDGPAMRLRWSTLCRSVQPAGTVWKNTAASWCAPIAGTT